MIFSSITFLFFFLPGVLLLVFSTPRHLRNILLLLASLLFYAWGEDIYILALLASILTNFLCGQLLASHEGRWSSRAILIFGVVLNIAMLAFFKYANFIADNLNPFLLSLHLPELALDPIHRPIGISFFTFQAISYLVDISRRQVKPARNPLDFALYLSFFPVILAGPILRYPQLAKELRSRHCSIQGFAEGSQRFILGLAKKVLLANPLALIADQIFACPVGNSRPLSPGLRRSATPCRSTLISPAIRTWPSAWPDSLVFIFRKTSIIPISRDRSGNSGGDGISPCPAGSVTTSIFRLAAAGKERSEHS